MDWNPSALRLLGTFSRSHMTYVAERTPDTTEPTLAEMTSAAIDLLAEAEDGYFLMVEGGRIDHGHHDGKPGYALLEGRGSESVNWPFRGRIDREIASYARSKL